MPAVDQSEKNCSAESFRVFLPGSNDYKVLAAFQSAPLHREPLGTLCAGQVCGLRDASLHEGHLFLGC